MRPSVAPPLNHDRAPLRGGMLIGILRAQPDATNMTGPRNTAFKQRLV